MAGVLPPRDTVAWVVAHWQGHIPPWATALGPYRRLFLEKSRDGIFLYFFYLYFAKIYGPLEIL
jgi:hypothetical protein